MSTDQKPTTPPFQELSLISTHSELEPLIEGVNQVIEELFQVQGDPITTLQNELSAEQSHEISKFCDKYQIDIKDAAQFQTFLRGLKNHYLHLPILELTLAFHPLQADLEAISHWLRANSTKTTPLLSYKVNPEIIGGCLVNMSGYFQDYSVRKMLNHG